MSRSHHAGEVLAEDVFDHLGCPALVGVIVGHVRIAQTPQLPAFAVHLPACFIGPEDILALTARS